MKKSACRLISLVKNSDCSVDYCPHCNAVHVHIGYTTLHMTVESYQSFASQVQSATQALRKHQQEHTRERREPVDHRNLVH